MTTVDTARIRHAIRLVSSCGSERITLRTPADKALPSSYPIDKLTPETISWNNHERGTNEGGRRR